MGEYLVYCPICYGGESIWPAEEEAQVVKTPLKASPNSDHVICDVHGSFSYQEMLEKYGNG
jgi:hypothetical protein